MLIEFTGEPEGQSPKRRHYSWMEKVCGWPKLAHGTPFPTKRGYRKVYFILAVGLKLMPSVWDPSNQNLPLSITHRDKIGTFSDSLPLYSFSSRT